MLEKIVEIIVYVISEMNNVRSISEIDIEELHLRGYTDLEISVALSWLTDKLNDIEDNKPIRKPQSEKSFRILHTAEKDLFTTQSWGELLQYHSLGIIDNETIEKIIEKAIMFGRRKIDSQQLKTVIAHIVFYRDKNQNQMNTLMLNKDDLIN